MRSESFRTGLCLAAVSLAGAVPGCSKAKAPEPGSAASAQSSVAGAASVPSAASQIAHGPATAPLHTNGPRVVVVVIYDQMGSSTLSSHLDALDPKGAIRTAVERGVYLERSEYSYANTLTAPGHVSIYTGAPPSVSGIDGNSVWDNGRKAQLAATEDPTRPVFGREAGNTGASPTRLRVPTVAHALRAATSGQAKIISLSIKDRSAILPVGTAADLVLWFDSKLGAFTSSSVWGPALPAWLDSYQREHPIRERFAAWTAENPDLYRARLGPDDAPGEGALGAFGKVFPHQFVGADNALGLFTITPMASEYLVALAETAARETHVGEDDVPDLVALSVSGTDAAGHVFGPASWEYLDHLIRADRAVGAWLARLEASASISVLITSDHGVSPLPETHAPSSGRLFPERLSAALESALAARFGQGPWVRGVHPPFVYLGDKAHFHAQRAQVVELARSALAGQPGVREAWTLERVRSFGDTDPIERAFRLSIAPDNDADLMLYTQPYFPLDLRQPPAQGTNHGTVYDYDRQVPVLAYGRSVPHQRRSEPVDQMHVAATISHLLGVPAPAAAPPEPLF